jgi:hypothetical protein
MWSRKRFSITVTGNVFVYNKRVLLTPLLNTACPPATVVSICTVLCASRTDFATVTVHQLRLKFFRAWIRGAHLMVCETLNAGFAAFTFHQFCILLSHALMRRTYTAVRAVCQVWDQTCWKITFLGGLQRGQDAGYRILMHVSMQVMLFLAQLIS